MGMGLGLGEDVVGLISGGSANRGVKGREDGVG